MWQFAHTSSHLRSSASMTSHFRVIIKEMQCSRFANTWSNSSTLLSLHPQSRHFPPRNSMALLRRPSLYRLALIRPSARIPFRVLVRHNSQHTEQCPFFRRGAECPRLQKRCLRGIRRPPLQLPILEYHLGVLAVRKHGRRFRVELHVGGIGLGRIQEYFCC